MKKQTMAKLIAVGMIIVAVGMSMGCVEDATTEEIKSIKDIQESPDNLEKELVVDGVSDESSPLEILGITKIGDIIPYGWNDYCGKEVTIEGKLWPGSYGFAVLKSDHSRNKPLPGFFLIELEASSNVYKQDIYVIYDGELPIDKYPPVTRTNSFGAVIVDTPGSPTQIKTTGIVEGYNYGNKIWITCINATSWEYI